MKIAKIAAAGLLITCASARAQGMLEPGPAAGHAATVISAVTIVPVSALALLAVFLTGGGETAVAANSTGGGKSVLAPTGTF
jgi:hypothetical protein